MEQSFHGWHCSKVLYYKVFAMMFQLFKYRFHAFVALLSTLFILSFLSSCVTNDEQPDTVQGNVEALWQILDEHYCFFEQKGIDWKGVRQRYLKQINGNMTERQQFEVMANMLSELKDGHVNLFTSFNIGRYWSWRENYPQNYSDSLERKYLKTNYLIASGMDYTILDDNIGYLRCESFQNGIGAVAYDFHHRTATHVLYKLVCRRENTTIG
jgi:hypothetical protein